ncbi:MAG: RiPP maturation radical SAM C-methyltransferase [Deltaproteobacteria bacterium]|nr:RiPP maturation radical SAM C-methyltransferase [Deltaproteobacteria bacterium]
MRKIALISAPWPFYNRPSIQLGSLKAFLQDKIPDLKVDALHLYLRIAESIGYESYQAISEKTWVAESLYAALLFPEHSARIKTFFRRAGRKKPILKQTDCDALLFQLRKTSNTLLDTIDWSSYGLIGFSVCLCQLTSSLYFIRGIKERCPEIPIVIGGSACAGELGRDILQTFGEIDFVVNGEGEHPLYELVRSMQANADTRTISIPGLVSQHTKDDDSMPVAHHQIANLDELPTPDYDDYFALLNTFPPNKIFFPTLPMEISRGCWWNRKGGCAFCNLNLQWDGYRSKSEEKVVSEIDQLTSRHQVLSIAFMDNLLPVKKSGIAFKGLQALGKDLTLFGEIRASTPFSTLEAMRDAGMREIQIGIEALSTSLLNKMHKGTTTIENIEVMKHCEELGITNISNLILYFPGSDEQDVDEILRALDFVLPYYPLKTSRFWLGFESPVWKNPQKFAINAVFNHPNYRTLFPPEIHKNTRFMVQGYRGKLQEQKRLWKPVMTKVDEWKKSYSELLKGPLCRPILTYEDGKDFLIIRQRRYNAENLTHRLTGVSRKVYLFCRTRQSLPKILERFPQLKERQLRSFCAMMVLKRLMFEEEGQYLSLAIASNGQGPRDRRSRKGVKWTISNLKKTIFRTK